jgi:Flp pilus assembly protein TadG
VRRAPLIPALLPALLRTRRAVAMLEFALALPLFLGFVLTAIEFGNYIMANNRVQRLAAMSADLVAQSGTGDIGIGEAQIYDLFSALDLTARPYDLRNDGRIVITGVRGTDTDNNGTTENQILWQRFDGGYVIAPQVGCNKTVTTASLPAGRRLPLGEILFHVQVSYRYRPILTDIPFRMLSLPVDFTRIAMFRARNKDFQSPTPDDRFPPKDKCTTASGL